MKARRKGGMRPASALLKKLVAPALRKQGFSQADIITRWGTIVGSLLAERSVPQRLRFGPEGGVLQVTVDGSYALELQHQEPVIIDRINSYFGYRAVARINMRQAPIAAVTRKKRTIATPTQATLAEAKQTIAATTPEALQDALTNLGSRIIAQEQAKERTRAKKR